MRLELGIQKARRLPRVGSVPGLCTSEEKRLEDVTPEEALKRRGVLVDEVDGTGNFFGQEGCCEENHHDDDGERSHETGTPAGV